MAFCAFSTESVRENFVKLDNAFIKEFLPTAPEHCVKVYLFGLYLCNNITAIDNDLASFAKTINLSEEDVISAFTYWQELGLVTILNTNPVEIRYLPVKSGSLQLKKINKDKYKQFNLQVQELYGKHMLTPNEFNEYYYTMESLKIEQDAMLMIVQYCIGLKGKSVNTSYVLTVAKNWAYEGIKTCEQVEERLKEQECADSDLKLVISAMGSKRKPSADEYEMFLTWTKQLNFELDVILFLAKKCKSVSGGINKLNQLLNKFYELSLHSVKEISDYLENEKALYETAKQVCKNLGVRYENLEVVVDTYISPWVQLGYTEETLINIAHFCFVSSIKTLDGMNTKVNAFYKLGLISLSSIMEKINETKFVDSQIKEILDACGILRMVNKNDRTMFATWVNVWNTPKELLNYAVEQSRDKFNPMQNINKMLSVFFSKKIIDLESAKKISFDVTPTKRETNKKNFETREYTKTDISGLFDSLTEVDV